MGRGAAILVFSQIALRCLSLISLPILSRLLGPEDYGVVAAAMFVLGLAEVVASLPLGVVLIRLQTIDEAHFNTVFTLTVLRGLLLGLAIFALAGPMAGVFEDPTVTPVLQWLALSPVLAGFQNPRFILFEKSIEFSKTAIVSIAGALGGAVVAIVLAYLLQNHWALVGSTLAQRIISLVVSYIWLARVPRFGLSKWNDFAAFGGWLSGANIVNYLNFNSDALLVGHFLGTTTLGYYAVGNRIATLATNELVQPFTRAVYPGLAVVGGDRKRLRQAYLKAQSTTLGLVLPVGVGTALVGRELLLVLLGDKWLPALPLIQCLAPVMAIGILNSSVQSLIMVTGEAKLLFYRSLLNFLLRIPVILIGLATLGFMGVIYARIFSSLANTLITLQIATRATSSWWGAPIVASWRTIVSCIMMTAAVLVFEHITAIELGLVNAGTALIVKSIIGAAVYVISHSMLWLVAGRPDGLERICMNQAASLLVSIKRHASATGQ